MKLAKVGAVILILLLSAVANLGPPRPAAAAPLLTITPASWDVIGLDSNRVTDGPNIYQIGAHVCNTGDAAATNLTITYIWDTANANINLASGELNPLSASSLAAGACSLFYFNVAITRTAAAYDTTRGYHITATATGLGTVSTPVPRQLYVEHLVSQNRNSTGTPNGPTLVTVGNVYTYTIAGSTATNGYEQLVDLNPFPNAIFQILSISQTYAVPLPGGPDPNDQEYADGCTWDPVPTSPTYRSCLGTGKAGGDPINATYTVLITGVGTATVNPVIYDYSGSSYHYNSDFGLGITIVAQLPTAAQVTNAAAARAPGSGVDLQWLSASEIDHLGFNVLRAAQAGGPFQQVNAHLILPDAADAGGGQYRFHDPSGTAQNWYAIQAVDRHNRVQTFPAFAVGKRLPALPTLQIRSPQATAASAAANAQALAMLPHPPLTSNPYKIVVSRPGVVRVTYEQLQAAQVPLDGVDPALLQLTSGPTAARAQVPLAMHVAQPHSFGPGDWFEFLAPAADSPYGAGRAYYLAVGSSPGARITGVGGALEVPPYPATFRSTLHLEENHLYWQGALNLGAAQPEGPWFWTFALEDNEGFATLDVPDADVTQGAQLTLAFEGYTSDESVAYDHHLAFYLNDTLLGDTRWDGLAPQRITFDLPAGVLVSGANRLLLHVVADTGTLHDGVYLTSADVTYTRFYQAATDALTWSATGGEMLAVHGFSTPDVVLYAAAGPGKPLQVAARVLPEGDSYMLVATVPGTGLQTLWAAGNQGRLAPDSITPVAALNLRAGSADYVVVAYDSLLAAAQQLAAFHAVHDGLQSLVVPVSAIYDQFGNGMPDAATLAQFFAYTQSAWQRPPHYIVLLGSASYDAHNYLGLGQADLVPTGYVSTTFTGRTPSDVALVRRIPAPTVLRKQATTLPPGLALGRLPAHDPAEAAALVGKLVAYSTTAHQWPAQVALVADQADHGAFDSASDHLAGLLPNQTVERVYESVYGPDTTAHILAGFNGGRALLNFYGHGSITQWAAENIFNSDMIDQIDNAGKEPFLTAMTCFNGAYDWALGEGIVTGLILKPSGGAIGGLGGSAASLTPGQHQLNEAFYQAVLAGQRVGDALLVGENATSDSQVILQFNLIGDPALRVDLGQ